MVGYHLPTTKHDHDFTAVKWRYIRITTSSCSKTWRTHTYMTYETCVNVPFSTHGDLDTGRKHGGISLTVYNIITSSPRWNDDASVSQHHHVVKHHVDRHIEYVKRELMRANPTSTSTYRVIVKKGARCHIYCPSKGVNCSTTLDAEI